MAYVMDPISLKTLYKRYWNANGWNHNPDLSNSKLVDAAIANGIMFKETKTLDHDGWVEFAINMAADIKLADVADAFVSSLTTRRGDLRSALGSYAVVRNLSEHEYEPARTQSYTCAVCGMHKDGGALDLNLTNFVRFKFSGVANDKIDYAAFDLQQFALAPKDVATMADYELLQDLLNQLSNEEPNATALQVSARLMLLRGNKFERINFLGTLGLCGILCTPGYPNFLHDFPLYESRPSAGTEMLYPASWWRPMKGFDKAALSEFFPSIITPQQNPLGE